MISQQNRNKRYSSAARLLNLTRQGNAPFSSEESFSSINLPLPSLENIFNTGLRFSTSDIDKVMTSVTRGLYKCGFIGSAVMHKLIRRSNAGAGNLSIQLNSFVLTYSSLLCIADSLGSTPPSVICEYDNHSFMLKLVCEVCDGVRDLISDLSCILDGAASMPSFSIGLSSKLGDGTLVLVMTSELSESSELEFKERLSKQDIASALLYFEAFIGQLP